MILADTTIWADHFRNADAELTELLESGDIAMHPFVLGEIALGLLRKRTQALSGLRKLPSLRVAAPEEVLELIEHHKPVAGGVGYIDVHLLATTLMTSSCRLWTRDKRLNSLAMQAGVSFRPAH